MCGRFSLAADAFSVKVYLAAKYRISDTSTKLEVPRYNIAPGQQLLSLINDGKHYRYGYLKWGFVPIFGNKNQIIRKIINFRSESLWDKPYLEKAISSHRCVVLADGFYEWQKQASGKTPFRIQTTASKLFQMAALWSSHTNEKGEKENTVALLTTSPNTKMQAIHERMPVILDVPATKRWLDPEATTRASLEELLMPYPDILTSYYPVSDLVNNYQNESSDCILERR